MKTAIVTGASGNMGQAVIRKFISGDYRVIGTSVPNDPVAIDFPADRFEKVVVNLMEEKDTADFINDVICRYGSIDAAVLTVGGFAMGSIAQTSAADILHQYKLNFETAYHTAKPLFMHMMEKNKGRIFIVGSKPGMHTDHANGMVAYGLAKSLIFRLAELMNAEAKGKNVVTSVIVPSTIDTPQNRKSMPDADFSKWVSPEDIANVIFYYSSDAASALREPV